MTGKKRKTNLTQFILFKVRSFSYKAHHTVLVLLFYLSRIRLKALYYLFGRIYLFYVEVVATTRCSLKCRDCVGYIPTIENENHSTLSFEQYKLYMDNLLANVYQLRFLRLLGGEPMLNKDLAKILKYSLEHKKIKEVFIVTNATVDFSDELIDILKQYPKKVEIDISNYSSNKELAPLLKHDSILEKAEKYDLRVYLSDELLWHKVSEIKFQNRSEKSLKKYFRACGSICTSLNDGKLFPCLRSGVFYLRHIGKQTEGRDYLNLSNPLSKRDFINFYSNDVFDACNYCSFVTDVKNGIPCAIQKKD
jgi:organic radical activating enzyme